MKEIFRSITKVTLAFVLILSLAGCNKHYEMGNSEIATLPASGITEVTSTEDIEPTLPVSQEHLTETSNIETTEQIELTEIESTKEEVTTVIETTSEIETMPEPTTVEETTTVKETTAIPSPVYTFTDFAGYSMYCVTAVNVRTLPSTDGEIIIVYYTNHEVWVTGRCNETGWYRIDIESQPFYISGDYLSTEKQVTNTPRYQSYDTSGFVYYTVCGGWPERAYEEYLYGCLKNLGIAWWYPYAVAQIWAESCWSPNSYNGVDAGICQFNEYYFPSRAAHHANFPEANVWNPYDSLYVYAYYIRDILYSDKINGDVEKAWSYYIKGHFDDPHPTYIAMCWRLYNGLEAR